VISSPTKETNKGEETKQKEDLFGQVYGKRRLSFNPYPENDGEEEVGNQGDSQRESIIPSLARRQKLPTFKNVGNKDPVRHCNI
jgi:hypothetical protein